MIPFLEQFDLMATEISHQPLVWKNVLTVTFCLVPFSTVFSYIGRLYVFICSMSNISKQASYVIIWFTLPLILRRTGTTLLLYLTSFQHKKLQSSHTSFLQMSFLQNKFLTDKFLSISFIQTSYIQASYRQVSCLHISSI